MNEALSCVSSSYLFSCKVFIKEVFRDSRRGFPVYIQCDVEVQIHEQNNSADCLKRDKGSKFPEKDCHFLLEMIVCFRYITFEYRIWEARDEMLRLKSDGLNQYHLSLRPSCAI